MKKGHANDSAEVSSDLIFMMMYDRTYRAPQSLAVKLLESPNERTVIDYVSFPLLRRWTRYLFSPRSISAHHPGLECCEAGTSDSTPLIRPLPNPEILPAIPAVTAISSIQNPIHTPIKAGISFIIHCY